MKQKGTNSVLTALALFLIVVVFLAAYSYFTPAPPANPVTASLVGKDTSCQQDNDCSLAIKDSWSSCNLGENCQPIDYSQDQWVGINASWYQQTRNTNCPPAKYPGRGCFPKPINDQYVAKCVQNICTKIPLISQ